MLSNAINWIEVHPHTVDLIKGICIVIAAWLVGIFRFFRKYTKKPYVEISESVSRCLIEKFDEHSGDKDCLRASFLLNISVFNPTTEDIVIRSFDIQIRRLTDPLFFGNRVSAISLPNRVRQKMGSGSKLMRNWFVKFDDGYPDLTIDGRLIPKEFASGFVMFCVFNHGDWKPIIINRYIHVQINVMLSTGERLKAKARILTMEDKDFFEKMVPGFNDQINDKTAWNAPIQ